MKSPSGNYETQEIVFVVDDSLSRSLIDVYKHLFVILLPDVYNVISEAEWRWMKEIIIAPSYFLVLIISNYIGGKLSLLSHDGGL